MFHFDDSPVRVQATPDCLQLIEEAHGAQPDLVVLLDDERAQLLPGSVASAGREEVIYLGDLATSAQTRCYASGDSQTAWWRHQATIDLTKGAAGATSGTLDLSIAELSDLEVAAALASGPLPRGLRD